MPSGNAACLPAPRETCGRRPTWRTPRL